MPPFKSVPIFFIFFPAVFPSNIVASTRALFFPPVSFRLETPFLQLSIHCCLKVFFFLSISGTSDLIGLPLKSTNEVELLASFAVVFSINFLVFSSNALFFKANAFSSSLIVLIWRIICWREASIAPVPLAKLSPKLFINLSITATFTP